MDVLPRITRQFFDLLRAMSPVQRTTLVTLPVLILGGLVWLVVYNQPQDFQAVSFGKAFASDELVAAEKALNKAGLLNYRRQGRKLLAPASELDRYNAALIEFDAVPSDLGSQILKQFETLGPFSTDRHRQEMKDALLLQELRQMIKSVPEIEDARVAVAASGRRVGFGQKPKVTANVTIKTRPGRELAAQLVGSLRQAVASMVPDLIAADVTIFDVTRGQAHSGESSDDPLENRLIQRVREFTRQYEQQIQKALAFIPNVGISVNVDLDNVKSSVIHNERIRINRETSWEDSRDDSLQQVAHEDSSTTVATGFRGTEPGPSDYSREVSEHALMAAMPRAVQVSVSIPRDYYRDVAARRKVQGESHQRRLNLDSIEEEVLAKVERTVRRLIPLGSPGDAVSVTTVDRLPVATTTPDLSTTDQIAVLAWRHGGSLALGLFVVWALWMLARLSSPAPSSRETPDSDNVLPKKDSEPSESRLESVPETDDFVSATTLNQPSSSSMVEVAPLAVPTQRPMTDHVSRSESARKTQPSPFEFLSSCHPDDIRVLLQDEHPQTVAVVTAHLVPAASAVVIAGFPPDVQADLLQRIAKLGPTDAGILAEIAGVLKDRLRTSRVRVDGVAHAADVLRASNRTASHSMLSTLDDQDTELADQLRQTLFSFDDLLKLDDATLRIVLEETDDRQWAVALKASPDAVRQKVFACLPPRIAQAFRDEMDSLGPVRLSEMTTVRQQIADSIHRLELEGLISLPVR